MREEGNTRNGEEIILKQEKGRMGREREKSSLLSVLSANYLGAAGQVCCMTSKV